MTLRERILAALERPAVTPLVVAIRMGMAERHQAVRDELTAMQSEGLITGTITGKYQQPIRRVTP